MPKTIVIKMAESAVDSEPNILESRGIGSCVVTCLYDRYKKIGALSHIMLPEYPDNLDVNAQRFANTALPLVIKELEQKGCLRVDIVAHVIGGASMFQNLGTFINSIGQRNVMAIRNILGEQRIRIVQMEVGGDKGRNVAFYLDSGKVVVTYKR